MSKLHEALEGATVSWHGSTINLRERIAEVKKAARGWLSRLGKNGYEHSERLEEYLDDLTAKPLAEDKLSPGEIFVLLCATYMHDIGYWHEGRLFTPGHPERSRDRIQACPDDYLLGDFPCLAGKRWPEAAEAVGWVCRGHSEERFLPLKAVPPDFEDRALSKDLLNLRKLAALLRLADEADDPYVRLVDGSFHEIRSHTPLVKISEEAIAWHWKRAGEDKLDAFLRHLREKQLLLVSSIEYLREIGFGYRYLVLYPQVAGSPPFMAPDSVETFVGRKGDVKKLHKIIQKRQEGAITGVVGTGGIGKTELAKRYAELYRDDYPGGVFWASLKGSTWKEEAPKILAELRPGAEPPVFTDEVMARGEVKKVLARRGALLIIDNVDEPDQIIKPGCHVLVTTRRKDAFGIMSRKAIQELPGLSKDEGVKLLKEVLGAGRVRQDQAAAERIVEILGGMPLAVEIAAKHLADAPDLRFTDYIGWVKVEKLKLENDPDRDVVASLKLSLDQLGKAKHGKKLTALFEAASVCAASGFTAETLMAAAGLKARDEIESSWLAGRLRDRSLLHFDEQNARYDVHPLVRQLAEQQLREDTEREHGFRENHCLYWLDFARNHSSDAAALVTESEGLWQAMKQTNQLRRTEELLPQFIESLAMPYKAYFEAGAYDRAFAFLMATHLLDLNRLGASRNIAALLAPLVEKQASLLASLRGWLVVNMGLANFYLGESRKALLLFEEALKLYRHCSDSEGECVALGYIALTIARMGKHKRAIELYEQPLALARKMGDVSAERSALGNMASSYTLLGQNRRAIALYEQTIALDRLFGDVRGEATSLYNMAAAYNGQGDYQKAAELCEKALSLCRQAGDLRGEGNALGNLGQAWLGLGDAHKAIELQTQRLKIARRIDDAQGEANALGNIGSAYLAQGDSRKALGSFERQLEIARRIGDMRSEGSALDALGAIYDDLGESRKAVEMCQQALEISRQIGDEHGEANALGSMGVAYKNLGDSRKAIELLEQQLAISRRTGDKRSEGNALGNMGVAHKNLGEYDRAISLYEQWLVIARGIGDPWGEQAALGNMGTAHTHLGDYRKSIGLYEQQLEITRRIGNVRNEGATLGNMGLAYAALGDYPKAIGLYEQALEIARRIEDVRGGGNDLCNMGSAYAALGDKGKAKECFKASRAIFEKLGLEHTVRQVERLMAAAGLKG
jgi:tetratricopeptide (TPR) repeat protein